MRTQLIDNHRGRIKYLEAEFARVNDRVDFLYENNKPMMQIRGTPGMLGLRDIVSIPIQDVILMLLDFLKLELEGGNIRLKEIVDDDKAND